MAMNDIALIDVASILSSRMGKKPSRLVVAILKRLIHQDWINDVLLKIGTRKDVDFMCGVVENMGIHLKIKGLENLPEPGNRTMFVCNHPLGGVDVVSVVSVVGVKYPEGLLIPANDFLLHLKNIKDMLIPVNKVGGQNKELSDRLNAAHASDAQLMFFPAGKVSRKHKGIIADDEWKKNFVSKSIEYHRQVLPIRIDAQNSRLFYFVAQIRKAIRLKLNIEMLMLPRELYRQRGKTIKISIGKAVAWENLDGTKSPKVLAQEIRAMVYNL